LFRNGVTTVVDPGSSGWRTFDDFKSRLIDHSRTRVLAMLNIAGWRMRAENLCRTGRIWRRNRETRA
jgi:dihydroorotase